MIRVGMVGLVGVLASTAVVNAQSPVERGRYLVDTVMTCHNCHTPMGPNGPQFDKALSGGLRFDEPPFDVTASNITPDQETGIGRWSEADIKKAIQLGVRPNGVRLAEIMPSTFYQILTPRDLDGIVAYLRSIPAVSNKVRDPLYKMQLPHQVFPGAEKAMPEADMADKVKRGFYLVTIAQLPGMPYAVRAARHRRRFPELAGQRRARVPRSVGRLGVAQHHVEQDQRHRRLERCGRQTRHHAGRA